jgi:hypothetical protein|tara:strand:+ start:486 stop:887 length:402 start_codon:yes stop_codon:yes gene_type:complete
MSTLKVDNIENRTGSSSSTTPDLISGRITASACVDATGTVGFRKSFNFSSVVDHGVGNFELNFTTACSHINYSYSGNSMKGDTNNDGNMHLQLGGGNTQIQKFTTGFRARCKVASNNASNDPEHFEVIVCQTD